MARNSLGPGAAWFAFVFISMVSGTIIALVIGAWLWALFFAVSAVFTGWKVRQLRDRGI